MRGQQGAQGASGQQVHTGGGEGHLQRAVLDILLVQRKSPSGINYYGIKEHSDELQMETKLVSTLGRKSMKSLHWETEFTSHSVTYNLQRVEKEK